MDGIEELKKNVERLKKNRENVPIETLKTKYKKGYTELLETIRDQATGILNQESMNGIQIRKADKDVLDRIQEAVVKGQFAKQAGKALFKEYSVEKFVEIVEKARAEPWPCGSLTGRLLLHLRYTGKLGRTVPAAKDL